MKKIFLLLIIGLVGLTIVNAQRTVNVYVPNPNVTLSPSSTDFCAGTAFSIDVAVTEQAGFAYQITSWVVTISDGTTNKDVTVTNSQTLPTVPSGETLDVAFTPAVGTITYTVTKVVSNFDLGGNPSTCETTPSNPEATATINVYSAPTAYNLTAPACDDLTNGVTITLANSQTGFKYQLKKDGNNEGTALDGVTGDALTWANMHIGSYSVYAYNTSGTCNATMNGTAVVSETPAAVTASNDGATVCKDGTVNLSGTSTTAGVSYAWTGPNGYTSAVQNPALTNVTSSVNGIYNLTITKASCTGTASTTVGILPVPDAIVVSDPSTIVCRNGQAVISVQLVAGTGNVADWYFTYKLGGTALPEVGQNTQQTVQVTTPQVTTNSQFEIIQVRSNGCTTDY